VNFVADSVCQAEDRRQNPHQRCLQPVGRGDETGREEAETGIEDQVGDLVLELGSSLGKRAQAGQKEDQGTICDDG